MRGHALPHTHTKKTLFFSVTAFFSLLLPLSFPLSLSNYLFLSLTCVYQLVTHSLFFLSFLFRFLLFSFFL